MKYNNLTFVIGLVGSASAVPYMTRRDTSDGKFEPLTTPASSPLNSMVDLPADDSPNYVCSTGLRVQKNICKSLLKDFVADADHVQHQGMPHRRDVHLTAGEKTPILTYSASAGDRRSIKLSRRGSDSPNDGLNREDAPAFGVNGCDLSIYVKSDALNDNGSDGLPMSQGASLKAFFTMEGLVAGVKSGTMLLLQNCDAGGIINLRGGVTLSISPPQASFLPQYVPNIPKLGPDGSNDLPPQPIKHKEQPTSQFGGLPYSSMPMGHDNGAREQVGDHSSYPPMSTAHEPESAQPPTPAQSGPSPIEQKTPEATHEDATSKSTSEASHEATPDADNDDSEPDEDMTDNIDDDVVHDGAEPDKDVTDNIDDDVVHTDAKPDEDVTDNDAAAEGHAVPETPVAGTDISEKAKAG